MATALAQVRSVFIGVHSEEYAIQTLAASPPNARASTTASASLIGVSGVNPGLLAVGSITAAMPALPAIAQTNAQVAAANAKTGVKKNVTKNTGLRKYYCHLFF